MVLLLQRLNLQFSRSDAIRLSASLILAVLLWGWVTNAKDPQTERTFSSVPVNAGELPAPLEVVGTISDVIVRVTGPRSVVADLTVSDINASLELSGIDAAGQYTVDINIETPRGVWSSTVSPSRIPIQVEEVVTELFVIETSISGVVESTRQVSASVVNASEITAVGPRSSIERIAKVIAPIAIENQIRDFTSAVSPVAVDDQGQPIPEVTLSPGIVTVSVSINARGKQVVVITQLEGEPAQGYEVVDRTINPATVRVDGPPDLIDELISVSTEPIDISGVSETLTRRAKVTGLPEGVSVIDPIDQTVDVIVQIRQIGIRQPLPAQDVQVIGLGDGLTATVTPDAVAVTVVATEEVVASLTTGDLGIQINVTGLGPGTYTVQPVVALPRDVTWISSDPAMVTVVITRSDSTTAPPAASPSPEPT